MKPSVNLFEKLKNNIFKAYSEDAGKMLLVTGTLAWITSSIAQLVGIARRKDIDKKQKVFLIPQEIADATINILSYFFVTLFIQNSAKRLVSKGKVLTSAIKQKCSELGISIQKKIGDEDLNIGEKILDEVKKLENTIEINKRHNQGSDVYIKELESRRDKLNALYDKEYSPFESGMKVVGNVIGAVISSNIITPILRNPIASLKQKNAIIQDEKNKGQMLPPSPIWLAQNQANIDNYRAKTTSVVSKPNSSMKI